MLVLDPWMILPWLVLSLVALVLLNRWLGKHVQGVVLLAFSRPEWGVYVEYLLLLPGTVLHELSHWVSAQLLGVQTRRVSLALRKTSRGRVSYGSVEVMPTDPVRNSLIGLAPLLAGSVAVLLCASLGLGIRPFTAPSTWQELWGYLDSRDAWIWVYLIFAISNAMLPSASDRRPWGPVALFLGLVFAFLFATNVTSRIPETITSLSIFVASYLAYAFTLIVAIDLAGCLLVWAVENLLALLSGRRVRY